jgi:hypothetical protein
VPQIATVGLVGGFRDDGGIGTQEEGEEKDYHGDHDSLARRAESSKKRPAFYQDSEEVLARAREGEYEGVIAGHLVTTFYYLLAKFSGAATADTAVDGLLADFAVAGAEKRILAKARKLLMKDFEDSVVAATADSCCCD